MPSEETSSQWLCDDPAFGWSQLSKRVKVHGSALDTPACIMEVSHMSIIKDRLSDTTYRNKLLAFLTLETQKSAETEVNASMTRILFWKAIFHSLGIEFFMIFQATVVGLVHPLTTTDRNHQKTAAEIIAGLLRAAKLWKLEDVMRIQSWLVEQFHSIVTSAPLETIPAWTSCLLYGLV